MNTISADKVAEFLEGIITRAMDKVAPVLIKKVSVNKINQWATQGIKISTKNSYYLYRQVKHGHMLKEEYKHYKRVLQQVIRNAKKCRERYPLSLEYHQ